MTTQIDPSDYKSQRDVAIKAWNTGREAAKIGKQSAKDFTLAFNNMVRAAMDDGAQSVKRAIQIIIADQDFYDQCPGLPKTDRNLSKYLDDDNRILLRKMIATAYRNENLEDLSIFNGDLKEESKKIANNSVDMIFTDPPYGREYLELYRDLMKIGARVLKDGGCLLAICGHWALPQIFDYAESAGLNFGWPIVLLHSGRSSSVYSPMRINVKYKPILCFIKGDQIPDNFIEDVVISQPPNKDETHDWAQSTIESDYYIEKLSEVGDLIFDPFMGSGTTGLSALSKNRRFVGIEIDKEVFQNTQNRLNDAAAKTGALKE